MNSARILVRATAVVASLLAAVVVNPDDNLVAGNCRALTSLLVRC